MPNVIRIRMKVSGWREFSDEAWARNEVGIWYGDWSARDWQKACASSPQDPGVVLKALPRQKALGWNSIDVGAVRRFEAIGPDDWVVLYLRQSASIGLARLDSEICSEEDHPLSVKYEDGTGETFKFRRIREKKLFSLGALPDAYKLLPGQGRGNIHQFHGMRDHVDLLAENPDTASINEKLGSLDLERQLKMLGASAWESVCAAYLTIEHQFVPTGLSIGCTLAVYDIVGRNLSNGARILAQCKKNPGPVSIDENFLNAVSHQPGKFQAYYFAYGGCSSPPHSHINVIDAKEILRWSKTEKGRIYCSLLVAA